VAIDMLIHDTRLAGQAPNIAENQWPVDITYSIKHIVGWTRDVALGSGGLRKLIIMAHGRASGGSGGYGIQLGKEELNLKTVDVFAKLVDKDTPLVKSIILYSCAVADTPPGKRMSSVDGNLLCSRLAVRTKAYVVASTAFQIYTFGGSANQPINFGSWEGDVYLYGPNGNRRLIDWGWVPD
jgi:hypothetical protein